MLNRRGKWAWSLFLGLIAWSAAWVGLFLVPVASAPALQDHRNLLVVILLGGLLLYMATTLYFIRRIGAKMKAGNPPP
jgi:hypothetical protein